MFELVKLCHNLGKDLPLFLDSYKRVKKEGLSREQIIDMLQTCRKMSDMKETLIWLNNHVPERMKQEHVVSRK